MYELLIIFPKITSTVHGCAYFLVIKEKKVKCFIKRRIENF